MSNSRIISAFAILVPDYDEAINYYVGSLGFELREDTDLGGGKRWVRVSPGKTQTSILLAKAVTAEEKEAIGNQSGGRVWLFLQTDDFHRDYTSMNERGVTFLEAPRVETYGTVAVFEDIFGNKWDLIEPAIS